MTQQYNFILFFCNKSAHMVEGLSVPPPKSCAETLLCYAAHVLLRQYQIHIWKHTEVQCWENLKEPFLETAAAEPTLAASHRAWRMWGSTTIPAPRGGKLCLDNCIEKKGTKMKANITHLKRQWNLWAKALMETWWHYILTHGTVSEKKKSCICHPLGAALCRTSQYTYLLTCSSRPKSEAEVDS